VLRCLSVSNIVIPPAKTGSESKSKNAVINTLQGNKGILYKYIPPVRIFKMVTIKLIAPAILLIPAMCNEKIARSTAAPG
jgi:hypothetical protein